MDIYGLTPGWNVGFWAVGVLLTITAVTFATFFIIYRIRLRLYTSKLATYTKDKAVWDAKLASFKKELTPGDYWAFRETYPPLREPYKPSKWDHEWLTIVGAGTGLVGVVGIIFMALMAIPYDLKYMSWHTTTGTVTEISNVLDIDGKYTTNNYIVQLDSIEFPVQVDNSRILTLEGEEVTLLCGVRWVDFGNSADQWSCEIKDAPYVEDQP